MDRLPDHPLPEWTEKGLNAFEMFLSFTGVSDLRIDGWTFAPKDVVALERNPDGGMRVRISGPGGMRGVRRPCGRTGESKGVSGLAQRVTSIGRHWRGSGASGRTCAGPVATVQIWLHFRHPARWRPVVSSPPRRSPGPCWRSPPPPDSPWTRTGGPPHCSGASSPSGAEADATSGPDRQGRHAAGAGPRRWSLIHFMEPCPMPRR
ncbi:hypothetical protein C8250_024775 [Streptomyces sp. So13.3]|nr:hypothetical protein C8250_024775 [Streptomyces sp. So13.3]